MPSVGRKFLLAGKGGLNLTHSEAIEPFLARYGARRAQIEPLLREFGPDALRAWAQGLGIDTFVGSSGRVFPSDMKAAPLLRAWLHRLRAAGVRFHMRHRWLGWSEDDATSLRFAAPNGELTIAARCTVLALGGGSWSRLGSDGAWVPWLTQRGVDVAPLQPSNCGFDISRGDDSGWSEQHSWLLILQDAGLLYDEHQLLHHSQLFRNKFWLLLPGHVPDLPVLKFLPLRPLQNHPCLYHKGGWLF